MSKMRLSRRTMLASAGLAFTPGIVRAADAIPVTLALSSNSLAYGGLRIAEQMGLFAKNGIAPRIIVMDSGNAATAALVGGSAQFASSGPGEVLSARARGLDVKMVINIYRGLVAPVTLAKAVADKFPVGPKGPLADRFKALDGLVLAVPSPTSALLAPIRASAEKVGAKPKFVFLAQPTMVPAMETGAIQGFVGSSPFWVPAVTKGTGVIWINSPHGELLPGTQPASSAALEVLGAYGRTNPDIVRRMRAVFTDVAGIIKSRPDDALAALAKSYTQTDQDTLKLVFARDADNWTQPNFSTDDVRQEIALLKQSADVPGLDAIKPEDVLLQ